MEVDLKQRIVDTPFVVLDVETTGLSAKGGDRIVDISMIKWQSGAIIADYGTLVNPCRRIPRDAVAIHGISDSDVVGAPTFLVIAGDVWQFIDGCAVVAHNATFDMGFINAELARAGYNQWDGVIVCTLALARKLHHNKHNKLDDVARHLGVKAVGQHTALGDTHTTLGVFEAMLTGLQARNYDTIYHLVRAQGGMKRAPRVSVRGKAVNIEIDL